MKSRLLFADTLRSIQLELVSELAQEFLPDTIELVTASESELQELTKKPFDLVVSFDRSLDDQLAVLPAFPAVLSWHDRPDRAGLTNHLKYLIQSGTLSAVTEQKKNLFALFDSLDEAVIAHDMKRRIIYFSRCAEELTGISAEEAVGADCHDLFPFVLCGTDCSLCSGSEMTIRQKRYSSVMYDSNQQRIEMETAVSPLTHLDDRVYGALIVLRNVTREKEMERRLGSEEQFHRLVGSDSSMQNLYEMIRNVGVYDFPVLIQGESGTGKELIADALHKESRRKGLFVPVNCGAIPEGTLESELFGHVKGSFTGAVRDKKGRFELADGGTIFLDEIGELPLSMQVKLLRVLQESTVEPVGGESAKKIDVRVVSATNKDLRKMVAEGTFREDLYYRLAVVPLDVPPLRDRTGDVIVLAESFLRQIGEKFGRKNLKLSRKTESLCLSYGWPGNVRQLQNAMQYAMIKSLDGTIEPYHLPPEISGTGYVMESLPVRRTAPIAQPFAAPASPIPEADAFEDDDFEDDVRIGRKPVLKPDEVIDALIRTGGNKAKAARVLNVGRATLYNYLKKYPEIEEKVPAEE